MGKLLKPVYNITMKPTDELRFFTSPEHQCSYIDDKTASTLFCDPDIVPNKQLYSTLSALGFRRSGQYLYRPSCPACNSCIPLRIHCHAYPHSRSEKRVLKRNKALTVTIVAAGFSKQHYDLYSRYIVDRHIDGDMYPPSPEQYQNFLLSDWSNTHFAEFHLDGKLIGCCVFDHLEHGLSAVYTYFDVAYEYRSLGKFAVLWLIEHSLEQGLDYLYLGYWIDECRKMAYKAQFHNIQAYSQEQWLNLELP